MTTITTNWQIQWMKTSTQPINGFNEVVLDVGWICTGTDDSIPPLSSSIYNTQMIVPPQEGDPNFIPYANLTQAEVLNWVWEAGVNQTATEAAVKKFQQDNNLTVDGIVGKKTLAMMEKLVKPINDAKTDDEAIDILCKCTQVTMKQFYPQIVDDIEDYLDIPTIYKILHIAAGINVSEKSNESVKKQATDSGSTWETLDLANLESEVFLIGKWRDYEELESSLSLPELTAILEAKREIDYEEKKFLAAMQGVDLEGGTENDSQKAWEDMKARVFSKGATSDSKDILALQGQNAVKAGFGIGMGIDYEDLRK